MNRIIILVMNRIDIFVNYKDNNNKNYNLILLINKVLHKNIHKVI
jgi:hypothetical protein